MSMNTYGFCRLDDADPDMPCRRRLMVGSVIHGGVFGHVTTAELWEEEVDLGDMFLVMATMQHKLLNVIGVARLEAKDLIELKKMFAATADSMRMFNNLLAEASADESEYVADMANGAECEFNVRIEELLEDKKEKA